MKHLQVDGQRVNVLMSGRHNSQTCSITQKQTEKLNLNINNMYYTTLISCQYVLYVNMSISLTSHIDKRSGHPETYFKLFVMLDEFQKGARVLEEFVVA